MRPTAHTRRAAASSLAGFLEWVQPQLPRGKGKGGGPFPMPFRGPYGLGLRAPPPGYKAGEALLTVPVSLWGPVSAPFALENAKAQAPHVHDALQRLGGLTVPIALAMHLGLALLDEADPIHPYARFLYQSSQGDGPAGASPYPLLLGGEALQNLFQASPCVTALEKRQRVYAAVHQQLFQKAHALPPVPFPLLLWAVSRILSRAVSGPGRPLTLVPLFDFLNHSRDPNCEYEVGVGPDGSDIVVRAMRDVRPGEELLISYGDDKDNHRLLTTYGFVDRDNPNRVQIAIAADGQDGQSPPPPTPQQRALLQRLGVDAPSPEWPPLIVGGREPDALARALAARAVLASPAPTASAAFPVALQGAALAEAVLAAAPAADRARVLDGALRALDARLRAYGTTMEEDRVALTEVGKGGGGKDALDGLRVSALLLRIEEKGALAEAGAWVKGRQRK